MSLGETCIPAMLTTACACVPLRIPMLSKDSEITATHKSSEADYACIELQ